MLTLDDNILNKTDKEIVELVLADPENFAHIIQRYKMKLFTYIRRITNVSPEEAEDILQNVFIKVYKNINSYDKSLKFSSWIYRIAHNEVIDNFRRINARPQASDLDLNDDRIGSLAHEFDIEKEIDRKYLKEKLEAVINQLDIKYREVLILKYFEEKDYKEISDIMKKPMGTIASRINRAKIELKKVLLEGDVKGL